jgi:hypothetical protein
VLKPDPENASKYVFPLCSLDEISTLPAEKSP